MDNDESDEIVATCRKYGDEDPQLWVQALSYFSKLKRADGCKKEIEQILQCKYHRAKSRMNDRFLSSRSTKQFQEKPHGYWLFLDIDKNDLLSPLLVVQTLSNNESTTLDLLKVVVCLASLFLTPRSPLGLSDSQTWHWKETDRSRTKWHRWLSSGEWQYSEENQKARNRVSDGNPNALCPSRSFFSRPILCQDSKCSACKMDLDIPCIHFFCEHSFHEQSVAMPGVFSDRQRIFLAVPMRLNRPHQQRSPTNVRCVRVTIGKPMTSLLIVVPPIELKMTWGRSGSWAARKLLFLLSLLGNCLI